jgi:nucleoside-diphosphate-sugar epimerase
LIKGLRFLRNWISPHGHVDEHHLVTHTAIVIGAGQIGTAVAEALVRSGWHVRVIASSRPKIGLSHAQWVRADVRDERSWYRAVAEGCDLMVDTIAYDRCDAERLLSVRHGLGRVIVISSSSVYRDEAGRTLDEARTNGFPEFELPISESQPTVDPGPETYSTRKIAMERRLLDGYGGGVSVLRPGAVHGPGSRHAREWWFVKRVLDGRPFVPLANHGRARFHTCAAVNIAALIEHLSRITGSHVLNIGDPHPPTVLQIGSTILRHFGMSVDRLLPLPNGSGPDRVGRTPWSIARPFLLATDAATRLGYEPVDDYSGTVKATLDWLGSIPSGADWQALFPELAKYPFQMFDYDAEDRHLSALGSSVGANPRHPG